MYNFVYMISLCLINLLWFCKYYIINRLIINNVIGMNVKLLWLNFICFLFKKSLCYKVNVDLFLI